MLKTKDAIYHKLNDLLQLSSLDGGISTEAIAAQLELRINTTSFYLNQMVKEGKLIKTKTRPVLFRLPIESTIHVFNEFIGSGGSLKSQIEQCKAAISYPPNGIPIIINGDSGVGKSYLVSLIHQYAIQEGILDPGAPFIELNCADYSNNPELLSSVLFGYVEGAFTGANRKKEGLIHKAQNGILFLDEIHRLSYENQEKLFIFMDKGKFRRLGQSEEWDTGNARFLFATTADLEKSLLATFYRRIPIRIQLPDFNNRPIFERLDLIEILFRKETHQIGKSLQIDWTLINKLLHVKSSGNIGMLRNCIQTSVANAYNTQQSTDDLHVNENHLPSNVIIGEFAHTFHGRQGFLTITNNQEETDLNSVQFIHEYKERIHTSYLNSDFFEDNPEDILDSIILGIQEFNRLFQTDTSGGVKAPYHIKEQILNHEMVTVTSLVSTLYGVKILAEMIGNLKEIFVYMLYIDNHLSFSKELSNRIIYKNNKQFNITKKIIENITIDSSIHQPTLFALIYRVLDGLHFPDNGVEGILVAHGNSMATSIAEVSNTLCGDYVFEPFDVPIESSHEEIISKITSYLRQIDTQKGVVLLVDMGSLQKLYEPIKNHLEGELIIVSNLTTLMAINFGFKIKSRKPFYEIIESTDHSYKADVKYYEQITHRKNIIISCISGIGIAEKIKNIFSDVLGEEDIDLVTMDYRELKQIITSNNIASLKGTQVIITTSSLQSNSIPIINIKNIINEKESLKFKESLMMLLPETKLKQIVASIVKAFSVEGIKNHLKFLNPDIIIEETNDAIIKLETYTNRNFENYLRLNLLMHISIMVERLLLHETNGQSDCQLDQSQIDFISMSKKIFMDIEEKYRIEIPQSELILINEIIENSV